MVAVCLRAGDGVTSTEFPTLYSNGRLSIVGVRTTQPIGSEKGFEENVNAGGDGEFRPNVAT